MPLRLDRRAMNSSAIAFGPDRPGAGDEAQRTIGCDGQQLSHAVAQGGAPRFVERSDVARSRALAAEERGPVVIEVAKLGGYGDGLLVRDPQAGCLERASQRVRLT